MDWKGVIRCNVWKIILSPRRLIALVVSFMQTKDKIEIKCQLIWCHELDMRTANSTGCVKLFILILSSGNFRMDPGLSAFFCLVWVRALTYCQVLRPQDVGHWKSELQQSGNHLLPKIFCHLYGYTFHLCSSWVSLNDLIVGTVSSVF